MTWFDELVGFAESGAKVRENLAVVGERLTSRVNQRTLVCGRLETPSLAQLRRRAAEASSTRGRLSVREVIADVQALHGDAWNEGALFQVASQFNLLEMVHPSAEPEDGVGIYEHDSTQGPACAIAAGAGTIYRNYFAEVNGRVGQSRDNQIDCLADLGDALGNSDGRIWSMRNGYALATEAGLEEISAYLASADETQRDDLRGSLRIGLQWNTQVTLSGANHLVSQAYCSALPVSYSALPAELWEPFARLVLKAAYEATVLAAVLNSGNGGSRKLFLTFLGGGAFGNREEWITDAIGRALTLHKDAGLDVRIVSYGRSKPSVSRLVREFSA